MRGWIWGAVCYALEWTAIENEHWHLPSVALRLCVTPFLCRARPEPAGRHLNNITLRYTFIFRTTPNPSRLKAPPFRTSRA
jgi:hypothetical protein